MNDVLNEPNIQQALTTRWLGQTLFYVGEVDSTNTFLRALAKNGVPAGTLVITDYQHQGKGRLQRRWEAPAGTSLLFSLLFRPGWPAERAPWLIMSGGLAAAEAIEAETGLSVGLKWPNDLVVDPGANLRKLGGLLLESDVEEDRLQTALLGIGINVNIPAEHLPPAATFATSLLIETGHPVPRVPLLTTLLARLEAYYDAATKGHSPYTAWNERLVTLHRPVRVSGTSFTVEGVAEGTDEMGQLLVRDEEGTLHTIPAGDVTLRE